MFRIHSVLTGMLLFLATTSMGCQLISGMKLATLPEADPEHPVVEIICVWQPGEGTGMDGLPCRGFAGQIIFFSMGEKLPVKVNGKVRIYVFDDQGTEAEQAVPIHQFDFDGKAFSNFLTNTNMGAAYQLFVPYTRPGTHSATCTLRVRYTPEDGSSVYSKMATIILPGTTPRKPDTPIEESVASGSRESRIISEVLQTQADSLQAENTPVSQAQALEQVTDDQNDKRRLRETLSAISSISPAQESPSTDQSTTSRETTPKSFKLHPLAEPDPPTPPAEQPPAQKPSSTPAEEPETSSTESSPDSSPAKQQTPPDTPSPTAGKHPLLED